MKTGLHRSGYLKKPLTKSVLEVPNIFVQEYLLENYKNDLCAFLPTRPTGELAISFVITAPQKKAHQHPLLFPKNKKQAPHTELKLNPFYTFNHFIEGPANQFVKSAAMGVANRPAKSYNPLFIHGGVGLENTSYCMPSATTSVKTIKSCASIDHNRRVHQ